MHAAKTLREAYNAVDPTLPLPAGDARYVDCNDVRGNEDTVAQMFKTISYSDKHEHQLFTGHRGCGKSTELLRLKDRLESAGFYVVYFAADEDLDPNDLIYSDLLLSIARQVETRLRESNLPLAEPLRGIERWFAEVVYTEQEWQGVQRQLETEASLGFGLPGVPLIARLITKLTGQIKTGDEVKTEIRRKLDRRLSQLIDQINTLLLRAEIEVRKQLGRCGIVCIVDNLDRITLKDLGGGRTSHDALFIEHGEQLCALACHTIYTVPISMMYGMNARTLRGVFPESRVLPMIKVHEKRTEGGGDTRAGIERLRSILNRRLNLDELSVPDAIEYLCRACGGHPRDLMTLVRHSIEYADEEQARPLTLQTVKSAERRLVAAFSRMIPEEHFALLARVYLTNEIQNDGVHQAMLFNQSVLEYADDARDRQADPVMPIDDEQRLDDSGGDEPWHDVHPALHKLARFQRALSDERSRVRDEA